MRRLLPVSLLIACCISPLSAEEPSEPVRLFDGQSFAGWEGNLEVFRIDTAEQAIVGGSLEHEVAHNDFLCTEKTYGDFELRLEFKVLGEGANAGIQFRTQRIPDHYEVSGYQADLGDGWWGSLYDESRRKRALVEADAEAVNKVLKRDDWNEYVIRAEGPRIQLWINGLQTVDYTEEEEGIDREGIIAVQIHGGPPSEAWYRNITLREL
jgi:hypothetical protein